MCIRAEFATRYWQLNFRARVRLSSKEPSGVARRRLQNRRLEASVYTNASLEVEKVGGGGDGGWGVATNGVIEVPAPGKQGFFILKSKPAAVSNRSGRPDTADVQHD